MKKKTYLLVSILLVLIVTTACSSKEADEIVDVHNDFNESVAEPMEELGEKYQEAAMNLETGESDVEEFIAMMDEIGPAIDELEGYIEDYEEPSTDDAKNYYNELVETFNLIFEGLDLSVEMTIGAIEESKSESELMDMMQEIEELEVKANENQEKLEELRQEYIDEYNLEFEDMEEA